MRSGHVFPIALPEDEAVEAEAGAAQQSGDAAGAGDAGVGASSSQFNTIAIGEPTALRIMVWNIANLGGGFGYPIARDPLVLASTAAIIDKYRPDILIVLEVGRGANPPKEPVFHAPYPLETLRADFADGFSALIEDAVDRVLARMREQNSSASTMEASAVAGNDLITFILPDDLESQFRPSLALDDSRRSRRSVKSTASASSRRPRPLNEQRLRDLMDDEVTWRARIRRLALGKLLQTFKDRINATMRAWFDKTVPADDAFRAVLEERGITAWHMSPRYPRPEHYDPDERADIAAANDQVNTFVQGAMRDRLNAATHAELWPDQAPSAETEAACRRMADRFLGSFQDSQDAQDAAMEAYGREIEAWDAAQQQTHHHGVAELGRIHGELLPGYSVWPATDAPDVYYGGKEERLLEGGDLDAGILYTERETYGIFIKDDRVRLGGVKKCADYQKRAPFIFRCTLDGDSDGGGTPISVIAYHAPSDSASNTRPRTQDLVRFMEEPAREFAVTSSLIFTAGDFNIDTVAREDIAHCDAGVTAIDFFERCAGHRHIAPSSFFWSHGTTFRRVPPFQTGGDDSHNSTNVRGYEAEITASAFDKILPFSDACTGWQLAAEAVIPLPLLLASDDWRPEMQGPIVTGEGEPFPDDFFTIPALAGTLTGSDIPNRHAAFGSRRYVQALLDEAHILSDHAPILADYVLNGGAEGTPIIQGAPERRAYREQCEDDWRADQYRNIGGGDCMFHAVLQRLREAGEDLVNVVRPADGSPEWNDLDAADLLGLIQALRVSVYEYTLNNYAAYHDIIENDGEESYAIAVEPIAEMGAWDFYAGDVLPLLIAETLQVRLDVNRPDGLATLVFDGGDNGHLEIYYNGFDHYT